MSMSEGEAAKLFLKVVEKELSELKSALLMGLEQDSQLSSATGIAIEIVRENRELFLKKYEDGIVEDGSELVRMAIIHAGGLMIQKWMSEQSVKWRSSEDSE